MEGNKDIDLKGQLSRSDIYRLLFSKIPDENDASWVLIKSLDGIDAVDGPLIKGQSADDPAFKSRQAFTFDVFVNYLIFNESNALHSPNKGTIPIGKLKGSLERNILGVLFKAASERNNSINRAHKTHIRALRVVQSKIKIMDRTLNAADTNSGTNKSLWLEVDAEGKIPFDGLCLQVLTDYAQSENRKSDALTKIFKSKDQSFDKFKGKKVPVKNLLKELEGATVQDYYSNDNRL